MIVAMSLSDHEQRLNDLETALMAALQVLVGQDGNRRRALQDEIHRLRMDGAKGAAALLAGELGQPYRR